MLDGDEVRQPLLNDNSIMDLSTSLRASSATQLRARYLRSVEAGALSNSVSFGFLIEQIPFVVFSLVTKLPLFYQLNCFLKEIVYSVIIVCPFV